MKKCIVVGGGFAGLTSAVYLTKAGFHVELLEASSKLGGRAYSVKENNTGAVIDNGQHILMGCYEETLKFIKLIKADDNFTFQKRLEVNFLKPNFEILTLKSFPFFYPLNLLFGLLNYKALTIIERLKLLNFFLSLPFYSKKKLKQMTVYEWLERENQNEKIRKAFWEILAVGALNTNIKKASAKIFSDVLKKIFLRGNSAATIILPAYGLSETYCNHAQKFIEENNGTINFSETVLSMKIEGDQVSEIITSKRIIKDFDFVVSAVPSFALERFLPEIIDRKLHLKYSSILSAHLWLNENPLEKTFYGLIDSTVHWIFNHGTHITIVISDANELVEKSKEEIFEIVMNEIERFTKIKKEFVVQYKVIKEKRATFIPSNEIINFRPAAKTQFKNFFLAGDWTDTGLPSTIESAVKSGRTAAEIITVQEKQF
ncbi:MAG: hydroxysqualene dehydroxylase HpnE [Ignavibacteriaceae bacterium]